MRPSHRENYNDMIALRRKAKALLAEKREANLNASGITAVFATPKTGRPGWNLRKSFPADAVRRELPFLVMTDATDDGRVECWLIRRTGASVVR